MNVGIPTEIKSDEQRVSLTPAGVAALRTHGHRVMVQAGAGVGSGFADSDYRKAGASIVTGAADVWRRADLILKVKEPQPPEYPLMRSGADPVSPIFISPRTSVCRANCFAAA